MVSWFQVVPVVPETWMLAQTLPEASLLPDSTPPRRACGEARKRGDHASPLWDSPLECYGYFYCRSSATAPCGVTTGAGGV